MDWSHGSNFLSLICAHRLQTAYEFILNTCVLLLVSYKIYISKIYTSARIHMASRVFTHQHSSTSHSHYLSDGLFFFLSRLLHKIGLPYQSVSLLVPLTKSPRRNKLLYFECRMSTLVVQWALYLIDRMPVPVGFRAVKRFG